MALTPLGETTLATLRRQRFYELPLRLAVLRTALELAEFNRTDPTPYRIARHLQERRHVPIAVEAMPMRWLENLTDLVVL